MIRSKILRTALMAANMLVLSSSILPAADGIISSVPDSSGNCHLKFPAIREETLGWNAPVLKDPSEGDIIDMYGPCDYDPLGRDAIWRQKFDYSRRRRQLPEGE